MKKLILILLLFSCKGYEVHYISHDGGEYIHYLKNNKTGDEYKEYTLIRDSLTWLVGYKMSLEEIKIESNK